MVLKPVRAIWLSMSCQLRTPSPFGAKVPVSSPEQLTPQRYTWHPDASTSSLRKLLRKPTIRSGWQRAGAFFETRIGVGVQADRISIPKTTTKRSCWRMRLGGEDGGDTWHPQGGMAPAQGG